MDDNTAGGRNPPDSAGETAHRPYRIDWHNIDERRRERTRHEAAGASRDLPTAELVGGGV
ncbi:MULTISPECIES: hypothetical protein [unclassified Haloarcula]|uniref:hypothetical protein n=1 Tax=unclassified Haloarcula TaxID=2624677 RepID=UPI000EF28D9C|nr:MULTISPECIES: hypothetical protein [unclassified Haloarcula]RLM34095.1 hypothetical protein DVK01_16630 [Haloarcula sp. Atlit-120R]RLM42330.1 hypothetical protein DVK00_14735 [Haloarcula sp. Atlit-47R]